jgi:hypothetical protein
MTSKARCEAFAKSLDVKISIYSFSSWQGWEYDISLLDDSLIYDDQTTGRSGSGFTYKKEAWRAIWEDLEDLVEMKVEKVAKTT